MFNQFIDMGHMLYKNSKRLCKPFVMYLRMMINKNILQKKEFQT